MPLGPVRHCNYKRLTSVLFQPFLKWMEPSPVRMVSRLPPPLILPWTSFWRILPSVDTGISRSIWPSLVCRSTSAARLPGTSRETLPSPVSSRQLEPARSPFRRERRRDRLPS